MNEQTQKLISELADKLGTTAEHLWGVLVRQAPIDATASIVSSGVFLLISLITIIVGLQLQKKTQEDFAYGFSSFFCLAGGAIALAVTISVTVASLSDISAGFINPEYWALKQILK